MKLGRIIWAADPLEGPTMSKQGVRVLRDLEKRTGATIEPVYVLSDGLLGLSVPKAELERYLKSNSEKALAHLVKSAHFTKRARPTVLVTAPSSRSGAAAALDRYARQRNAEFIVVNSHGRGGLKRAVLGSFAETLTLHSKTPVLISGPQAKHVSKLDHILFPTDFTRESKKAYKKVLELAAKLRARVTIFHVVFNPIGPIVQSGVALLGGGFVTTTGHVDLVYDRQKKAAAEWVAEGRQAGLTVDTAFAVDRPSVIASILDFAKKKKPGMIAMASESSATEAVLLGSIGRGVAREAPCPVWFLRS